MRLFVAIDIDEAIRRDCRSVMAMLKDSGADLRLVQPENLHLTLKFLGEVREVDVKGIDGILYDVAKSNPPFRIALSGLGYFGPLMSPRVVWIGISRGSEEVLGISRELNARLSHIREERKEPSPHLTLARVRSPRGSFGLIAAIRENQGVNPGELHVKELKLKQSVLKPGGPEYSDLKVYPLGGGG